MKSAIAKIAPIAIGLALGWLLFHPPAILKELGPIGYLLGAVVCFALLVGFIAAVIGMNLPADVAIAPLHGQPDMALQSLATRLRALGFADVGPPYEVGVSPPASMMAFVHPNEPIYAAVYRTGTIPAVVNFDFVSILDGFRGGLTSNPDVRGATLPPAPGSFRQIFPGRQVEDIFARHREGVAFLGGRGFSCKPVNGACFVDDFKRALGRQREAFLASPIRTTLAALARTITKKVPDIGPLSGQPKIEERLRELATGRRG
jgi:hypothetical protein